MICFCDGNFFLFNGLDIFFGFIFIYGSFFFLVNNLLLLNQVPDLQADKKVGRNNILMKFGVARSMYIFSVFVALALAIFLVSIRYFDLPNITLLGLIGFAFAVTMILIVAQD